MKACQEGAIAALGASAGACIARLDALEAEVAAGLQQDEAAVSVHTDARLRLVEERAVGRAARLHAGLQRVEGFIEEAEHEVNVDRASTDRVCELAADSRLQLARATYAAYLPTTAPRRPAFAHSPAGGAAAVTSGGWAG